MKAKTKVEANGFCVKGQISEWVLCSEKLWMLVGPDSGLLPCLAWKLSLGPVRLHLNTGAAENYVALKDISGSYFLRKPSK